MSAKLQENRDKIIDMYRNGRTCKEIAEAFGSTTHSISMAIHRWRRERFDIPFIQGSKNGYRKVKVNNNKEIKKALEKDAPIAVAIKDSNSGTVIGQLVATVKDENLKGFKHMIRMKAIVALYEFEEGDKQACENALRTIILLSKE